MKSAGLNGLKRWIRYLSAAGVTFDTVYDIGCHQGSWTKIHIELFPDAAVHLFDINPACNVLHGPPLVVFHGFYYPIALETWNFTKLAGVETRITESSPKCSLVSHRPAIAPAVWRQKSEKGEFLLQTSSNWIRRVLSLIFCGDRVNTFETLWRCK